MWGTLKPKVNIDQHADESYSSQKVTLAISLQNKSRVDFSFNSFNGHLLNVKDGCLRHSLAAPVEEEMV